MAEFKPALKRTDRYEGGYVNDPRDNGGETYRGISRVNHAKWKGWSIIDQVKEKHGVEGINKILPTSLGILTIDIIN